MTFIFLDFYNSFKLLSKTICSDKIRGLKDCQLKQLADETQRGKNAQSSD